VAAGLFRRGKRFNPARFTAHAAMSHPAFVLARHPGAGRDPVAGAVGFRDNRALTSLDSGLRRNDGEGNKTHGK
jgi:hypothetical protein